MVHIFSMHLKFGRMFANNELVISRYFIYQSVPQNFYKHLMCLNFFIK